MPNLALPDVPVKTDTLTPVTLPVANPISVGDSDANNTPVTPPKIKRFQGPPAIELMEEPILIDPGMSLMFNPKDMHTLVIPSLALYDKAGSQMSSSGADQSSGNDDLTGLLESLKGKGETKEKEVEQPLPNIYMGSILYSSDASWSIWLNGKKLTNKVNSAANPIYVESIDSSQAQIVWKPASAIALNKIIREHKNATPDTLSIDAEKGRLTFTLRPNQTFVPSLLAVLEGLIKQTEIKVDATSGTTASASLPASETAPQPVTPQSKFKGKPPSK
jgi:hypothetical protein